MTTREKILAEALSQFNNGGVGAVSIRSIAHALQMSPGNLTYHFKNTDAIIEELYLRLVQDIDNQLADLPIAQADLPLLYAAMRATYGLMWRYRFILRDFAQVAWRVAGVRTHFRQLVLKRRQQFRFFYELLIERKLLLPEWTPGLYDRLTYVSIVLGNAWLADAEVHFERTDPPDTIIDFYTDLTFSTMFTYLTDEGRRQVEPWLRDRPFDGYPGSASV